MRSPKLADLLEDALPQTQCTKCGYPDCRGYAEAMADGERPNRCPPGGQEGIIRLSRILDFKLNEEINQIDLIQTNSSYIYNVENHDFIYLNDNHYIVPGVYVRENVDMTSYGGSNSVKLVELVFQEIVNNQVVFEWNSAEHPELLGATDTMYYEQYATSERVDYFHFNYL